jgi:hypothetical protein
MQGTEGQSGLVRTLAALTLFGISFGYVEAAVVVYLRALYEPVQQRLYPGREPHALFPLLRLDQLEINGEPALRLLAVELAREAATLALLAAAALAVARNGRQWFAAFVVAFGLWDIFYYVFLKVLLDWPQSLETWDLLFLLPVPWAAPVLAPLLVALSMVVTGVLTLGRETAGRPLRLTWGHWAALVLAGLLLVASFCWDYENLLAGGEPRSFPWPLFALGKSVALAAFLHAFGKDREPSACPSLSRSDVSA